MEEMEEKDMDGVASFKGGKSLTITGKQNHVCSQIQSINLLASSNRYGYVFYATESDGLTIISSAYIDEQSRHLTKSTEDDEDDDDEGNQQQLNEKTAILRRPYIPGQQLNNKASTLIPIWIALNADESVLAVVLSQVDTRSWLMIFYQVVKLIQMSDSTPVCPPLRIPNDAIGDTIQHFAWNPAMPNIFAYIDGTGAVSTCEINLHEKQIKMLGKSQAHDDNSSICWSPKGKQLVVVTYEGALELYDSTMILKKKYASVTGDGTYPPCISVQWLSTNQFLLGYSENSPEENSHGNSYFHLLLTFDKEQRAKVQVYYDQFFDSHECSPDINPQYFYLRLNETKILIAGLTKSLKINVLGPDELNQDSLDIWAFADQFRATVRNASSSDPERPVLTGMALGLNSKLQFTEGNQKLPPCPVVYLANDQGILQVYYFTHKNLPSICRKPEVIPAAVAQASSVIAPTNGFSNFGQASLASNTNQSKGLSNLNQFGANLPTLQTSAPSANLFQGAANPTLFNFGPTASSPSMLGLNVVNQPKTTPGEPAKSINSTILNNQTPVQQSTINTVTFNQPQQQQQQQQPPPPPPSSSMSSVDNKKLLQSIEDFQSKLQAVQRPIAKPSESATGLDSSIGDLLKVLRDMTKSLQTSIQSIRTMTSEHIKSSTRIEDAQHSIRSSQKENLHHLLRDRELDPWTQSRLDTIQTKYDRVKSNLDELLEITNVTIHDRSVNEEDEHEDFLPDLQLSVNRGETIERRMKKQTSDLQQKLTETEKDVESICSKFNGDILSSTTFNKTAPMRSSKRSFHASDADLLSYLRTTRPQVQEIQVPPPTVLNVSSATEPKKSTITELPKPVTPLLSSATSKQADSPTVDSESYKNMLRLVRTSIDLFSGAASPDQLQELAQTIATSPFSPAAKSTAATIHKTPTASKLNISQNATTINKSLQSQGTLPAPNLTQTPAKSVAPPVPAISVTPPTPASQISSAEAALKLQTTKPIPPTPTDLSKTSAPAGSPDSAIRSLLGDTNLPSPAATSLPNQSVFISSQSQIPKAAVFGNVSSASTIPLTTTTTTTSVTTIVVSAPAPVTTTFATPVSLPTTAASSVSVIPPTTTPTMATGSNAFGARPAFTGAGFSIPPATSTAAPFGTSAAAAATTSAAPTGSIFGSPSTSTATSASSPFVSALGAALTSSTATTPAPNTGFFGALATSASSPFGGGFGTSTTAAATSTTPTPGIFGSTTTSTAPVTSIFGGTTTSAAPTTGSFGGATTSTGSPFGSGFANTTSTTPTSSFGSGFGSGNVTSPATSPFGNSFGAATSAPSGGSFGSTFGPAPSTATTTTAGTTFAGFGTATISSAPLSLTTTTPSIFGGSSTPGFGSSAPATSTAAAPAFGSGPAFGSTFTGFATQSAAATPSSGFTFGGFGSQASDPSKTAGFSSFGSPTSSPQVASPFAAAAQPTAFGNAVSSFGATTTQTALPSFTSYRK